MSATELKNKIYEAVDSIEDTTFLQAILTMTKLPFRMDDAPLTDQELTTINKRKEEYLQGKAEPLPWREVQARIKEKHGL